MNNIIQFTQEKNGSISVQIWDAPESPQEKVDKEFGTILNYLSALGIAGKRCFDDPETKQRFIDQLPGYLRSIEMKASRLRPLKLRAMN